MKQGVTRFFKYARARHAAYHEKMAGKPPGQQTKDPIIGGGGRFTNVFRELDKTTVWFREKVRDPLRDKPEILLATVVFRLLNRIEVGEAIFCQTLLPTGRFSSKNRALTAWDAYLASGDVGILQHAVKTAIPNGPYATGAYIISSPPGYSKLSGILEIVRRFNLTSDWRHWTSNDPAANECTLEVAWEWLKENDYFGPFHSYEIVTDLRHTALLDKAPDIMTWANPGPGARRGANRVNGREKTDHSVSRDGLIEEMQVLLSHSKNPDMWPQYNEPGGWYGPKDVWSKDKMWSKDSWPKWEMREVEHTLCEFDKYERIRTGEGRTRGVYR